MAIYRTWSVVPSYADQSCSNLDRAGNQAEARDGAGVRTIPVRIRESEHAWFVDADVPGVAPVAIGVEFFQDRLTLRYERKHDQAETAKYDDLAYGTFERVIRITDEIKPDRIAAKYHNGVLRLELPKSEVVLPRKIQVTAE